MHNSRHGYDFQNRPKSPSFASLTPNRQYSSSFMSPEISKSNDVKQQTSSQIHNILSKISMLKTATNRLNYQHISLKQIKSQEFNQNVLSRLRQFVWNVRQMTEKVEDLKVRLLLKKQSSEKQSRNQKQFSNKIQTLKQQLHNLMHRSNESSPKRLKTDNERQINLGNQRIVQEEVNKIVINSKKVVQRACEDFKEKRTEQIDGIIRKKLNDKKWEKYFVDIESDLGLLICEIQFIQSQHNTKQTKMTAEETQKLKYEIFMKESFSRINYDTLRLDKKIQIMKKCMTAYKNNSQLHKEHLCYDHCHSSISLGSPKNKITLSMTFGKNQKMKHKPNMLQKYQSQLILLKSIMEDLEKERDGIILRQHLHEGMKKISQDKKLVSSRKLIQDASKKEKIENLSEQISKTHRNLLNLNTLSASL